MNYYKLTICFMLLAFSSQAQDFVTFNETNINQITENSFVTITLPFNVEEGYHIQSEIESIDGSLTTEITFEDNDLYEIVSNTFSKKNNEQVVLDDEYTSDVLINEFEVTITLKLNNNISGSRLKGELYYQACTDRQCLLPRTLNFQVPIK